MTINTSYGRLQCNITGEDFGPDFGSKEAAEEFLGFIGYYPEGWRGKPASSQPPRGFARAGLAGG